MKSTLLGLSLTLLTTFSHAEQTKPAIEGFGFYYDVLNHAPIAEQAIFKVVFDVADAAQKGKQNNSINSLARFINMHIAHGVKPENIQLALVVHGGASVDLLENSFYKQRFNSDNKNQQLISQLLAHNTVVYVCGQSATHMKVKQEQLIPGVQMALSAMTAHALLQQQGYTLNPF
ncbi:DsrE family protein [Pseudoalteromonas sp. bablab_jr011]|uniref:DsrE family protein n=1 Tax=Pseudoalteromonas sp. bablab_jr011 TaxID=2755062 RepID=UPI0018F4ED89|nr:DsrE family protein [Pseudoalteromonas sp. bablab_jr011]